MKIKVINKTEYIVKVKGNYNFMINEMVEFDKGNKGIVLRSEKNYAEIALLDNVISNSVEVGQNAKMTSKSIEIFTSKALLGSVVDVSCQTITRISNKNPQKDKFEKNRYLFEVARPIYTRSEINKTLFSGTPAIDWAIPIAKGQRELILGDRKTGKTSIALNMIFAQKTTDVKCIYVSIGQKRTELKNIIKKIKKWKMEDRVTIVASFADDTATKRYLAPYVAMTLAEHFQKEYGNDVLVILDDLSKHAVAYRELSLLLENAPSREAYPGDIFYLHSSLLERAGSFSKNYGLGSITAIPIVQTENGDISSFIPTNVISITDGQIFTSKDLFNQHQRPAINVPYSVSRIGSIAQSNVLKKYAKKIKFLTSRYHEAMKMKRISNFVSRENSEILAQGDMLYKLFKYEDSEIIEYELGTLFLILFEKQYLKFFNNYKDIVELRIILRKFLKNTPSGKKMTEILINQTKEEFDKKLLSIFLELEILPIVKYVLLSKKPELELDNDFKLIYGSIRSEIRAFMASKRSEIIERIGG